MKYPQIIVIALLSVTCFYLAEESSAVPQKIAPICTQVAPEVIRIIDDDIKSKEIKNNAGEMVKMLPNTSVDKLSDIAEDYHLQNLVTCSATLSLKEEDKIRVTNPRILYTVQILDDGRPYIRVQ